jgi:two-component system chemotaxis response regulator CheB
MTDTPSVKVLLADDSAVIRRLLTQILEAESDLSVVAVARNGLEAIEQWKETQPDVILMDVEMPVMDGIEAVAAIRTHNSRVPIIMFASATTNAAEATLDALQHGATDFVTRPSRTGNVSDAVNMIRRELLPKIRILGRRHAHEQSGPIRAGVPAATWSRPDPGPLASDSSPDWIPNPAGFQIVALGASTGGPNALSTVLERLSSDLPVPVLIVQHMPPTFCKLLAERLNRICPLPVREAVEGAELRPGTVWVAPGDWHMTVRASGSGRTIHLDQNPPEKSCRPSIDVLFRSLAKVYGDQTLAVVLTGMGKDGLAGCQAIRQAGGMVICQDEATSSVWGMPRSVSAAGLAQRILAIQEIAPAIVQLTRAETAALSEP